MPKRKILWEPSCKGADQILMRFLHATLQQLLIVSLFAANAHLCVAQPPMIGVSGDSGSSGSSPPVRIVEPADGATIHDNNGNMIVKVEEEPTLAAGTIEFFLDGQPVAARQDGDAFIVSGVERGTHNLQARSIGANGETAQSDPITFTLWKASALFRRKP